jgi:hypothetical protein
MLMGEHKMQRMVLAFLEQYHKDADEFLNHIVRVTGDETWLSFVNFETKEQSNHWIHIHSPKKLKKLKQTSARKLMATVLWGRKGVLMVEFKQQGTTIMSEVYCEKTRKLDMAIQNRRHGMLTYSVVLLYDSACPHTSTAAHTQALLDHFNWKLFDHPPYSPDLAPCYSHLCSYLKN